MKNLVSILLVVMMLFAFTTVSMAADVSDSGAYTFKVVIDDAEIKAGEDFEAKLYLVDEDPANSIDIATGNGATINFKIKFTDSVTLKSAVAGYGLDSTAIGTATAGSSMVIFDLADVAGPVSVTSTTPLATYTFTAKETLAAGSYDVFSFDEMESYVSTVDFGVEVYDFTYSTDKLTIVADEPVTPPVTNVTPDKNAGAEVTLGENKYTGIYTYSLETNVTSFNLVATYNEGLTKNLKYAGSEAIELNNVAIKGGDATITFKIAIVGVPADVTISGLAIQAIQ